MKTESHSSVKGNFLAFIFPLRDEQMRRLLAAGFNNEADNKIFPKRKKRKKLSTRPGSRPRVSLDTLRSRGIVY